ncbi:MAG: hypothetical protein WD070_04505, partial [Pirellulaceae bacterium]
NNIIRKSPMKQLLAMSGYRKQTDPDNATTTYAFSFDGTENSTRVSVNDRDGVTTHELRDGAGQLRQGIDAVGATTGEETGSGLVSKTRPDPVSSPSPFPPPFARRADGLGAVLRQHSSDEEALVALYLKTLSRGPTKHETQTCLSYVQDIGNRNEAFEDILWSLINSTEFLHRN